MGKQRRWLWAGCVAWLASAPVGAAEDPAVVAVAVGAQRVIPVAGITRVAVGNPQVADVRAVGTDQLLVIGRTEGRTTLLVWRSGGPRRSFVIQVRRQDPQEAVAELSSALAGLGGVRVRREGDRVLVEGEVRSADDARRVEQALARHPAATNLVKVAIDARRLAAEHLNGALRAAGVDRVKAAAVGALLLLEGTVDSPEELKKVDLVVRAMGETAENLVTVGRKRMILSEVQFVEIRGNSTDRFGIKHPTDITGSAAATFGLERALGAGAPGVAPNVTVLAQGSSSFSIALQDNDGSARLLAQPKLVCASGEEAEFVAGGQVPIPLVSANQASVEYKEYGIILKLKPTADRDGNIHAEIEAEASDVDTSVAVSFGGSSTVPGFRTRKVKTSVTVRHGETIVLSGVFTHDEQKSVSKVPGLGHIPIIGELFKSRGFDEARRELVILVTPRIVDPGAERIRELIEEIKGRYRDARDEVGFSVVD